MSGLLDELLSLLDTEGGQIASELALEATAGLKWIPNPGPQTEAYFSEADELFYGGAAGGGKTDLLLGLAFNAHKRSLILRREGTDLQAIIQRATEVLGSTDGLNFQIKRWALGEGHTLELGSVAHEKDKFGYQGRAHDLKAFDELTQFTRSQYEYIIGWNRSTAEGQRCRVVAAGNPPSTPEGMWVKEAWAPWLDPGFGDPAEPGELRWFTTIDDKTVWLDGPEPLTVNGVQVRPQSRTFIPALLSDNPYLGDDYRSKIAAMPEPLRSQLLYGDFNVASKDQANQVIPTAWVRAAQERWKNTKPGRMVSLGVDVAQGGNDRTAIAPRHEGLVFGEVQVFPGSQTPDGPSVAALAMTTVRNGAPINLDMGGGFGQSAYDHLVQNGVRTNKINGASASSARTDDDARLEFVNKRAELWWRLRELLDPAKGHGTALPPDEALVVDLCAPTWKLTPRGIQVEAKDDIRRRIGRSTDRGDALVYAAALPLKDDKPKASRLEVPNFGAI